MRALMVSFIISGCYTINRLDRYDDTKHSIVESDSVVYNGKLIFRVFKCENNCGYNDTFPNPAVDETIKGYLKLMSIQQTARHSHLNKKTGDH